jgi:hypothetical protein
MSSHTSGLDNALESLSRSRSDLLIALETASDQYFNTSPVEEVTRDRLEYWSICEIAWYVGALDDVSRLQINDIGAGREVRPSEISRRPEHVSNIGVMLVWVNQSRAALSSSISRMTKNQLQEEQLLFKENSSRCEMILRKIIANETMSTRRILELIEMFRC